MEQQVQIKIKKKRKPKEKRNYFTKETENAILEFNDTEEQYFRDKIYRERIEYGFFKLTQNIIHTFKFYYTDGESIEDLQQEVISFLLSKIHLYKPEKGAAYSYFGTIAKRYLIIRNKKAYQKLQDKGQVDEIDNYSRFNVDNEYEENIKINISEFLNSYILYMENNLDNIFFKENDKKLVNAILELFRKRENLSVFNKKALYIYILGK